MKKKFSEKVALFIALLDSGAAALTEGVSISLVREKWLPDIRQLEGELETYRERHRDAKSNFASLQRLRKENAALKRENELLRKKGNFLTAHTSNKITCRLCGGYWWYSQRIAHREGCPMPRLGEEDMDDDLPQGGGR